MSTVQASTSSDVLAPFVERLTVRNWCAAIFPRLVWRRVRGGGLADRCRVIDGSRLAMGVARVGGWLIGVKVERLTFRVVDVRDEYGVWMWMRVTCGDLATVQADAMEEPVFQEFVRQGRDSSHLRTYLGKSVAGIDVQRGGTLASTLLMVRICDWVAKRHGPAGAVPVLFAERRLWRGAIARYASRFGVLVVHVPARFHPQHWLRRRIPPELKGLLRHAKVRWQMRKGFRRMAPVVATGAGSSPGPRICVEYYGHLSLQQPERYSDLFFWQQSSLSGRDLLMTFNLASDPVTEPMWAELTAQGIEAVALDPRATTVPQVPVFTPRVRVGRGWRDVPRAPSRSAEGAWLCERTAAYRQLRDDWTDFFAACGAKIYLTWFKYYERHCVIAEALERLGGITAIYQRAYEDTPTPEATVHADIVFGFSQATAEVERRARSMIRYHVTVGYPGDHRFPLLRERAEHIRQALQRHGAQRILAFADESSLGNPRLFLDHQSQQENYRFLLEKLLQEPWLGLVIKPKAPANLRWRLGPVADLLRRAEATGRCYIFGEGRLQGSYPPAAAALAADVAVYGHLFGGTAGLEMALAGVPTLLLDREGWPLSALYRLGIGRAVFTEWDALWKACVEHWARPGGVPGFGDWTPMLGALDPFRDGRAAERIGTYVQWLLEGFRAGLPRETVMADAAERYAARWGNDKITSVNCDHPIITNHQITITKQSSMSQVPISKCLVIGTLVLGASLVIGRLVIG